MVVCLKHVGITDWVGEMLTMSVKSLASWLIGGKRLALSTRPGNLSGPAACLTTSATECEIRQSSRTAGALMHGSVLLASRHLARLVGLYHWAARGWVSLCNP